jgi:hypothetical protein
MSKLYQISTSDGMSYITRENNIDEFYKQKFYEIKTGCIIVAPSNQPIRLFDLSKNDHVGPPTLLSSSIIRVQRVIKGSGLEELYLKILSGIEIVKTVPKIVPIGPKIVQ